jgi:predicted NUDIX family phosphoesterase
MGQEEQVLVVERKVIEQAGMFQGLVFDVDDYLSKLFVPGGPRFMPRSKAEADPAYKQLIPYVIMACDGRYLGERGPGRPGLSDCGLSE